MHKRKRNTYKVLVVKPEEKRPRRRHWRRWMDNIKVNLKEVGRDDVD
jgi:hypothetical protein